MSGSEWSHALLALLCLVVGTGVMCPLMPTISLVALSAGVAVLALYILVRLWPQEGEDES